MNNPYVHFNDITFIMFNILNIILNDFRDAFSDDGHYLFFSVDGKNPDIISYLQKVEKNPQLVELISRFSKKNAIPVALLIDKYGIKPSQLALLKKGKRFYIEDLDGNRCFLKRVN